MPPSLLQRVWGVACVGFLCFCTAKAADDPSAAYTAVAQSQVNKAASNLAIMQGLVEQGTLPRSRLDEAQTKLADAQDELVLAQTLYGKVHVQDLTDEGAAAMVAAARRRVDREQGVVDARHDLLNSGILARSEFAVFEQELASRRRVLELAENRVKLLDDLKKMVEAEHAAETNAAFPKNVMIRYSGNGHFGISDLPTINGEFQRKFGHALPVSALGQTLLHRSMGLDHRDRVDVALSPDSAEGVWLRHLLEQLRIPYLAFRSAVAGAATAPHIHIGPGSTRLVLARR
ncbi:MAG TPA: hypothetical protein VHZ55_04585 [Bryobacteraceae bacterium]|nr:hypothetical protein [Bryobacteraceae bacterium]